jgi:hypothetical protein
MPSSDATTYFGLWSAKKIQQASALLTTWGVRYEIGQERADRHRLVEWCAWDSAADDPHVGFNLWIRTADLPKLGPKLVEAFPERKFGAP